MPPSTASGPRSFESRWVETGKTLTFSRPGGSLYAVSATSSIRCCLNHAFASAAMPVKVATAAMRVTVTFAVPLNGKRALATVNWSFSSFVAFVAADQRDLEVGAGRGAGVADAHALALEEAVGEPARAVGADELAARRQPRRAVGRRTRLPWP